MAKMPCTTAGCRSLDPKSEAYTPGRTGVNLSDHRCKVAIQAMDRNKRNGKLTKTFYAYNFLFYQFIPDSMDIRLLSFRGFGLESWVIWFDTVIGSPLIAL
jgi:hypothetical protein